MLSAIRALPHWVEIAVVIATAFGMFILGSISAASAPSELTVYSAADFTSIAAYEIVVGTALLAFLFARGWRIEALGFRSLHWRDGLDAALLFAAVWSVAWAVHWMLGVFGAPAGAASESGGLVDAQGVGIATLIVFCLINAGYEELFVCAYLVAAWRGPNLALGILLSALVRLSYHLYQGPIALLSVLPFGLLLAWYFARTRRIAALIALHFALDMLALLPYARL
ncbi:MAG: CPBP family intramembrane glutamic endopeptidase [Hyphomonadaceae bacterium]